MKLDIQLLPLWIYRPDATLQDYILLGVIILGYALVILIIGYCLWLLTKSIIKWLVGGKK